MISPMVPRRRPGHFPAAILGLVLAALTGVTCGGAPTATSSSSPATGSTPSPTSAPAITLSEADSGRTIPAGRGAAITLVLHSTYWTIQQPTGDVLAASGDAVIQASPGCVPGEGCGTVTERFTAVRPGPAQIVASRSSCGEALRCVGGAGSFQVTVVVTP